MNFLDLSQSQFLEELASSKAVPGGGGASAMVGAIGISLGHMVGALTTGKKTYAAVEEDIQRLMSHAMELQKKLSDCVNKDAEAFEPLSKAYGLPKDDPNRETVMEQCLRNAAAAPLEILDLCCESLEVLDEFAHKGSRMVISDAATGAVCCWAALYGAAINVKVNTKLMKDRKYAEDINRHVDEQVEKYWKIAEKTYEDVYSKYC